MSTGEIAFLTMVIVAFSAFAVVITYASFVASGMSTLPANPALKPRGKTKDPSAKTSNARVPKGKVVDAGI